MSAIQILAAIGLLLSVYAYYVERKTAQNASYKAFCDLTDRMSCAKAFGSKEGHMLGFSNALGGIGFYLIALGLTYYGRLDLLQIPALLSFLGSLYLAYVSYIKMKNFCLVCTGIYLVNLLLLIFTRVN